MLVDFDEGFGPNFPVSEIDMDSFHAARSLAAVDLASAAFLASTFPAALNSLLGTSHSTWDDYLDPLGFSAGNCGLQLAGDDAPLHLARYRWDGALLTDVDYREAVSNIMDAMPGGYFHVRLDGTWRISLPDPALAASAHITIENADLISYPEISVPNDSERLTSATGRYTDAVADYINDSQVWPDPESTLATALKTAEGGRVLATSVGLPGASNKHQAHSRLATIVLQSRRRLYSWTMVVWGVLLEPGDVVDLPLRDGTTAAVRVSGWTMSADGRYEIAVNGIEWSPVDFYFQAAPDRD